MTNRIRRSSRLPSGSCSKARNLRSCNQSGHVVKATPSSKSDRCRASCGGNSMLAAAGRICERGQRTWRTTPGQCQSHPGGVPGPDSAGTGRSEADRPVRSLRSTSDEAGYLGCRDCRRGDLSRGRHPESPTRAPVEFRPPARHASASRSRTASGLRPAPPPPTPVRWPGESSTFRSRCRRGPHASPRTSFVRTTTDANAAIGRS